MRQIFSIILFFLTSIGLTQNNKAVLEWINKNAIDLQNYDNKNGFHISPNKLGQDFLNAGIYGFGEATHHNKEFFQIKTEFFKYLVLNRGVRVFILEESFGAGFKVNQYINGNGDDLKNIISNFRQSIWKTQEMFDLISWIKSYNSNQNNNKKIQFYGNDCMFNFNLISILKTNFKKNKIILTVNEENLLNFFSNEIFSLNEIHVESRIKINEAKDLIHKIKINHDNEENLTESLNALSFYLEFLLDPTQTTRDRCMSESVSNIYEKDRQKIFICGHNDHIKKTKLFKTQIESMGSLLKKKYKNLYYSTGFEFGIGKIWGYDPKKNSSEYCTLEKPIKNTNSEFLYDASLDTFYFDFETALNDNSMTQFLSKKRDYIMIGGYGLVLSNLKYQFAFEKYIEMYDGLIYIKKITPNTSM